MSVTNKVNNNKRKLVLTSDEEEQPLHVDAFYRFKVLLPNGMTIPLRIPSEKTEMPLEKFLLIIKGECFLARKQQSPVDWKSQRIYLQDAEDNTIQHSIKLSNFKPNKCHILRLHDGLPKVRDTYENMWDLTPDTDLLMELPEEYSIEAALADLIDNSLQAVWFQRRRRLISVEIRKDKITIFDTGSGMDDSDENSIMKWGKMGASLHRSLKSQAIGGKPPYLRPFFGMFGYGGPIASMFLGRCTIVSSKTTDSKKVFTLHLERDALLNSTSKGAWRTNGGMRDPSEDEIRKSPQGSFTKVDILDLKMKELNIKHIRFKLKDIYFPYIQCDEASETGKTSTPIEFKVNGVNLAEIEGGEVSIANLHSCNGPEFIFHLLFSANLHNSAKKNPGLRASSKANARLKCLYFPISEGKENIERILEKLEVEGIGTAENYETFSRVSVRRLGRLLPDARWSFLPFMDLRQKKGEKAHILKRCCSRVKCFIDTDGGFNPAPSKTDLAHHNPFSIALKNFGNKTIERETEVNVEISRDGKVLTLLQLEKEYQEWIIQMHGLYDEEIASGEDEPVLVVAPSNKKKLGISSDVMRVHKILKRKGTSWRSGQRVKVLKGACAGVHSNNIFATLEYFLIEGFQGDAGGEARIICRPLGLADDDGCQIEWNNGNASLNIRGSLSLPISVIDSGKCQPIADSVWNFKLEKEHQKAPSAIDLLSRQHCKELEVDGGLPDDVTLHAGCNTPREIVAVFRPAKYNNTGCLDQKYIVKTNIEMSMEVKYRRMDKDDPQLKYSARVPPSSHKGIGGLYIFQLGSKFPDLFKKSGIYSFSFISTDSSCEMYEKSVEVRGSSKVGKWELISNKRVKDYSASVGSLFPPLSIACFDIFDNQIPFTSIPNVTVKLVRRNNFVLAQVDEVRATISSDRLTLQVKDLMIETSDLDQIRPNFRANLVISSENELISLTIPCKVLPGSLRRVNARSPLQHLLPGSVVKELIFEMFDAYGNHVMKGLDIQLIADGLCFPDGMNLHHKVDDNGCIDISGVLKVSADCGDVASVAVSVDDVEFFKQEYHIEIMAPRTSSKMMKSDEVQSPHSDGKFLLHQDTPSLEHVGNLVLTIMGNDKLQDLDKDVYRYGEQIAVYENQLKLLEERKAEIEQSIYSMKACNEPVLLNNLDCLLTKEEVVEQIKDRNQSAAAIVSYLSRDFSLKEPQNHIMSDILGVVAVLGTVSNRKLSRILSMYLGEDYMLAVVCTSYKAASALEMYDENGVVNLELGLHAEAAALGKRISDRFLVFCLEDMRPYNGTLDGSPQRKLLLPNPVLPSGEAASGFIDYAVNMVELEAHHLDIRTVIGHGLRETLFYRLFGQVQVYNTRNHMMAARSCIKYGAVSLDGGIIKEDGLFSLGYRNPEICFPVTTLDDGTPLSQQLIEKQQQLQHYEAELMDTMALIESCTQAKGKIRKKLTKVTDKYNRLLDKVDHVAKDLHNSSANSSAIVPSNNSSCVNGLD